MPTDLNDEDSAKNDKNAIWDGDELKQAAWLQALGDELEGDARYRTFIFRGVGNDEPNKSTNLESPAQNNARDRERLPPAAGAAPLTRPG